MGDLVPDFSPDPEIEQGDGGYALLLGDRLEFRGEAFSPDSEGVKRCKGGLTLYGWFEWMGPPSAERSAREHYSLWAGASFDFCGQSCFGSINLRHSAIILGIISAQGKERPSFLLSIIFRIISPQGVPSKKE